jgi:outer membrane lipoprotein-sorting protein
MRSVRTIIGWVLSLVAFPALGQTRPTAAEILQKATEAYSRATAWELDGTITTTIAGRGDGPIHMQMHSAGKGTTKRRLETGVSGVSATVIIVDGETVWAYSPKHNQYTQKKLSEEPAGFVDYLKQAQLLPFQTTPDKQKNAQVLREEPVSIGGKKMDCYVVQFRRSSQGPTETWWIDKNRFVVLREEVSGPAPSVGVWTVVNFDGSVPDELFVFTPPPGARPVDRIDP